MENPPSSSASDRDRDRDRSHSSLTPPSSSASFRLLCPYADVPSISASISHLLLNHAGVNILIQDPFPSSDDRVILIFPDSSSPSPNPKSIPDENDKALFEPHSTSPAPSNAGVGKLHSSLQQALLATFETMIKLGKDSNSDINGAGFNSNSNGEAGGLVVCRLLASSHQVGHAFSQGAKSVDKITQDTGAQVRILPDDQIPTCASPGDNLIQITGSFSVVKKALLSVSSILQGDPSVEASGSDATRPFGNVPNTCDIPPQVDPSPQKGYTRQASDNHPRDYNSIQGHDGHRMTVEEDVVFKLLCHFDKVGNLIGKGGHVVKALQNETGAYIKIFDAVPDSDERIVVISARESMEQMPSPAQEAVIRVNTRLADLGFEPGAPVVARLLVHSQQIGYLLGQGGFIIHEMRRATGASIHVVSKEQVPKCVSHNDEMVQIVGKLHCVQDALFHITSRLRETIFPLRPPPPNLNGQPYLPPVSETPYPSFRPRHNPPSPGHYTFPSGMPHMNDRSFAPSQPFDRNLAYSRGIDHTGSNQTQIPHPYGAERGPSHPFDRPSSPRSRTSQAVGNRLPSGTSEASFSMASRNGNLSSSSQLPFTDNTSIELVIPQNLLSYVYGDNHKNLDHIRQISEANVMVYDPKPRTAEGKVVLSGSSIRVRAAQRLVHAFILSGQSQS